MCVCVCVCVRVCVCVCVYKCDKSKQCYSCYMQNTTSRITLQNVKNFHKVHKVKIKKKYHLHSMQNFPSGNVAVFPCRLKFCIR